MNRSAITKLQASLLIIVVVCGIAAGAYAYYSMSAPPAKTRLIVSTTTSLYETGFLDYLKTKFELKYTNMNVSFISQGTGLAIQTAMRGDDGQTGISKKHFDLTTPGGLGPKLSISPRRESLDPSFRSPALFQGNLISRYFFYKDPGVDRKGEVCEVSDSYRCGGLYSKTWALSEEPMT